VSALLARLGIPKLSGNGKFVTATGIDSVGTGLVLAFTVIYFVKTTPVSLPVIGVAMTLARLFALPTSVTVGPLIDRFTARRTALAGNLVSAAGYTCFLFARASWSIVIVVFLVQVGHTTYWTSSGALVGLVSPDPAGRPRWFAFVHAVRNSGLGVGAALGAFAFGVAAVTGLRAIVIANAASYFLAAGLLAAWRPASSRQATAAAPAVPAAAPAAPAAPSQAAPGQSPVPAQPTAAGGSYGKVLRDARYTTLMSVNLTFVFAQMLISVLLAIYIVTALHAGAWIAGTLLMLNTIQVALAQTVVSSRMERYRTTRVIAVGSLLNAAAFGVFALLYASPRWLVIVGLFGAMIVFSLGEIIVAPALDHLSVALAQDHIRGRYLAVYQLSWTTGQIAAPGILTFLLARGAVLPMLFLLALCVLAVPLLLVLERMRGPDGERVAGKLELAEQV
jgi:MFS family permease